MLALLTPFGIHNFYAKRFEKAFVNLFLDILMIVFYYFTGVAWDKVWHSSTEQMRAHYNSQFDGFLLLLLICAIISVVWRIAECCIVTHDGNGVKMK